MRKRPKEGSESELPLCAVEFIRRVARKIRYRRRVRREVQAELMAHFEDAVRDGVTAEDKQRRAQELIEEFGDAKLLAALCRRAKKRCRPLWQKALVRGAQLLGVLVLYLVACSLPLFWGKPTLRVNYAEWLNHRWRPSTASAANARSSYDEAVRMYVPCPGAVRAKQLGGGNAFSRSYVEWFSGYNAEEMKALGQWLTENQPAFRMLRKGAQTDHYWPVCDANRPDLGDPNTIGDALQLMQGYREVVLAFRERIAWEASRGDVQDALADCLVLQRLGRHLQDKGFLNDQLVGISIESLCYDSISIIVHRSDVPGPVLAQVQKELEAQFDLGRRVINLDAERAFWYDNIQRHFTDDGRGGGRVLKEGFPFAAGSWKDNLIRTLVFDYPGRRETVAMVERYFEQTEKWLATIPGQRESKGRSGEREAVTAENMFLNILQPAHERVALQAWRLKTHEIATIALLAIQRYAKDTGGHPASLEPLVERGYLKSLPADPFGQGSLTYKRTDDAFLLYSWGADFEDDGGRRGTDSQGNPNRWADNGDWVFWPVGP